MFGNKELVAPQVHLRRNQSDLPDQILTMS